MKNYLIVISYDGSNYYGFQRQKNLPTIQREIEGALAKVYKKPILIKGAGRTDKNVHAKYQCASFMANDNLLPKQIIDATNRYLPEDIRIIDSLEVDNDFHARFSAKKKTYEYKINVGKYDPCLSNYMYQPKQPINIKRLRRASKLFKGTHDFKNFVSGEHEQTISHIFDIIISKRKNIITIKITGTHFYKYMVRNIVGSLIDFDKGKIDIDGLKDMINIPEKQKQLTTIMPNGLYLTKIYY